VTTLALVCLGCAALPAMLFAWNVLLFRAPSDTALSLSPVSVLIPARNEERSIAACVGSVLASHGVELEVIVLDDHSTDRTADLVREIAAKDGRVRLEVAPPLPPGWCGKQHACFVLAKLARHDTFAFLDADVRLAPDALARMSHFLHTSKTGLVSGFPRQETGTLLEKLVLPLMHLVLLGFLPLAFMRWFRWSAFGAGCGQLFVTSRAAYEKVGGHAAIKESRHDGVTLPRAYRRAGFFTDIADATDLATCRMYRSAGEVWNGLAKNAREGLATNGGVGFWTVVLVCGQVLPLPLWIATGLWQALAGVGLSFGLRLALAMRFRQSMLGVLLHPVGVLALLAVQWFAVYRAAVGRPVGWKGRARPDLSSGGKSETTG
jgi:glycosyltransferase involved in cell wall biosynthesis